jgi:hypothetical protein
VTKEDVVAMVQAGVADELIVIHIRSNGFAGGPLSAGDLIWLKEMKVNPRVVQAMQAPPPQQVQQVRQVIVEEPPPVIVEPYWGPRYYRHYPPPCYHRPRGVSYGISISN